LNTPTKGRHVADRLSDRKAAGLLLAFLAAVILVAALATVPLSEAERSSMNEPIGSSQSRLR